MKNCSGYQRNTLKVDADSPWGSSYLAGASKKRQINEVYGQLLLYSFLNLYFSEDFQTDKGQRLVNHLSICISSLSFHIILWPQRKN